jgi:uncharacterized SAM-binding protein YcdF (DUF218 family)
MPNFRNKETDELVKTIWEYFQINLPLEKADAIFVFGGYDTRVADKGAKLYLEGWARVVVCSGHKGRVDPGAGKTEADNFAHTLQKYGVPDTAILKERKSLNTGENILFTKKILEENNIKIRKAIVLYHTPKRVLATFQKQWPEVEVLVYSPQRTFDDIVPMTEEKWKEHLYFLVGDLQRMKIYPEKGYQAQMDIPDNVWQAYEKLVALGYDRDIQK